MAQGISKSADVKEKLYEAEQIIIHGRKSGNLISNVYLNY